MDRGTMHAELTMMAKKAGPAVLGSAGSAALGAAPDQITILGLTTGHWAIIASMVTIGYVLAQGFFLFRDKWWRDPHRKKKTVKRR